MQAKMNPYDEQRLRNEVIFLHSLWHQGPPQPQPPPPPPLNPFHLPIPTPQNPISSSSSSFQPSTWHLRPHHHQHHRTLNHFAPAHTRSLPPIAPTTAFKKKNKKKNRTERRPDPGPEWPCSDSPDPPPNTTGWAPLKPLSAPTTTTVSPQEKEKFAALQAQNKACQAFRKFLTSRDYDVDDEDDDGGDNEEEDDDDDELEEFEEFFIGVFMEDNELRWYYQRCFENGEFCCLVCGAIGKKKSGKKFKDCAGLVQHSMSILRTVKKWAHRAFGQALCKVLGWDIDRLPTIVMKGEPLGIKQAEAQGEPKENDKVVSLENADQQVEEHELGSDQSTNEGEPKENADDNGKDGTQNSDDKFVSSELGDEPVEQPPGGVDQSTSEVPNSSNAHQQPSSATESAHSPQVSDSKTTLAIDSRKPVCAEAALKPPNVTIMNAEPADNET